MPDMTTLVEAAREAVLRASEVCRVVQRNLDRLRAITKDDRSPVTIADFASQAVVANVLRTHLGDVRLVAEESSAFLRDPAHAAHLQAALDAARTAWHDVTAASLLDAIDIGGHHHTARTVPPQTTSPERKRAGQANNPLPYGRGSLDEAFALNPLLSPGFWTLDPIDGTKGFLRGHQYAVCLAYIVGNSPILGVLGCPNLPSNFNAPLDQNDPDGCLYISVKGQGLLESPCLLPKNPEPKRVGPQQAKNPERKRAGPSTPANNPLPDGRGSLMIDHFSSPSPPPRRIIRRPYRAGDPVTICESFEPSHSKQEATARVMQLLLPTRCNPPVRIDSQCKYALVARGQADVYLRLPTKRGYVERIWDHASGALIASEMNCIVSDARGIPLDFSQGPGLEKNRGIVAAPAALHPRIIEAIHALGLDAEPV